MAPILVAVAGAAGSGKTSVVGHIVDYLARNPELRNFPSSEEEEQQNSTQKNAISGDEKSSDTDASNFSVLTTSTPISAVAVSLDGYHRYRSELSAMPDPDLAFQRRGAPFTFNPILYERDLLTLMGTGRAAFPSFEHHIKDPKEQDTVVDCCCWGSHSPAAAAAGGAPSEKGVEVVIIEGLYTLFTGAEQLESDGSANPNGAVGAIRKPIPYPLPPQDAAAWADSSALFDLRLFVDCPLERTTERLTKRHMAAWGISRDEALVRASGSDYDNSVVVARTKKNADCVLRSVELQL